MKRLLVISDLHCGHQYGITPTRYHSDEPHYGVLQKKFWDWYCKKMDELSPFDYCVCNGDAVDGPGVKSTVETRITDMGKQKKAAIETLEKCKAKEYFMTFGTPVHVTGNEEHELSISVALKAKIKSKLKIKIGGFVFDFKHHTGKSSIPHGGGTLLKKSTMWEHLKHTTEGHALPDVTIRSHIHEWRVMDDRLGLSVSTPAMQLGDTIYGRKFDGWYDVGFFTFTVGTDSYDYEKHLFSVKVEDDLIYAK